MVLEELIALKSLVTFKVFQNEFHRLWLILKFPTQALANLSLLCKRLRSCPVVTDMDWTIHCLHLTFWLRLMQEDIKYICLLSIIYQLHSWLNTALMSLFTVFLPLMFLLMISSCFLCYLLLIFSFWFCPSMLMFSFWSYFRLYPPLFCVRLMEIQNLIRLV